LGPAQRSRGVGELAADAAAKVAHRAKMLVRRMVGWDECAKVGILRLRVGGVIAQGGSAKPWWGGPIAGALGHDAQGGLRGRVDARRLGVGRKKQRLRRPQAALGFVGHVRSIVSACGYACSSCHARE
jgi:hypothetical protein